MEVQLLKAGAAIVAHKGQIWLLDAPKGVGAELEALGIQPDTILLSRVAGPGLKELDLEGLKVLRQVPLRGDGLEAEAQEFQSGYDLVIKADNGTSFLFSQRGDVAAKHVHPHDLSVVGNKYRANAFDDMVVTRPWPVCNWFLAGKVYDSLEDANPAIRGIDPPVNLTQANLIAEWADNIEGADNPWAVAISQFKETFTVKSGRWVREGESEQTKATMKQREDQYRRALSEQFPDSGGDAVVESSRFHRSFRDVDEGARLIYVEEWGSGLDGVHYAAPYTVDESGIRIAPRSEWVEAAQTWTVTKAGGTSRVCPNCGARTNAADCPDCGATTIEDRRVVRSGMVGHAASRGTVAGIAGGLKGVADGPRDSVMVAFFLPRLTAEALALKTEDLPEGSEVLEPGQHHVTLAFLGPISEQKATREALTLALEQFASEKGSITGSINGLGRFSGDTDGKQPVYANFDAPDLPTFREELVNLLEQHGAEVSKSHGFTPHITLAYVPVGAETSDLPKPETKIIFDQLALSWGDEMVAFPLGEAKKAERDGIHYKTEGGKQYPASDYLVVEDRTKPTTWHLRFTRQPGGPPNHEQMGQAAAALTSPGGHRGKRYQGPNRKQAIAKLRGLYRQLKVDEDDWPEGLKQKSLKHVLSVLKAVMPELPDIEEEGKLSVFKTKAGQWRWATITSAVMWDRQEELVTRKAMDFALAYAHLTGKRGPLRHEHVPGLDPGVCDWQMRVGDLLFESGYFHDTPFAQQCRKKYAADPGYKVSAGLRYQEGDLVDGVYHRMVIFERSVTKSPAVPFTALGVRQVFQPTDEMLKQLAEELEWPLEDVQRLTEMATKTDSPPDSLEALKTAIEATKTDEAVEQLIGSLDDSTKAMLRERLGSGAEETPTGEETTDFAALKGILEQQTALIAGQQAYMEASTKAMTTLAQALQGGGQVDTTQAIADFLSQVPRREAAAFTVQKGGAVDPNALGEILTRIKGIEDKMSQPGGMGGKAMPGYDDFTSRRLNPALSGGGSV